MFKKILFAAVMCFGSIGLVGCEEDWLTNYSEASERALVETTAIDALVQQVLDQAEADAIERDSDNLQEIQKLKSDYQATIGELKNQLIQAQDAESFGDVIAQIESIKTGNEPLDAKIEQWKYERSDEIAALKEAVAKLEANQDPVEGAIESGKVVAQFLPSGTGEAVAIGLGVLGVWYRSHKNKQLAKSQGALQEVVGGTEEVLGLLNQDDLQQAKHVLKKTQSTETRAAVEDARALL